MKINLVLDCLDYGDGVSNDVLAQQEMLHSMGYDCDIYTSIFDPRMENARFDIGQLNCGKEDILIHHYSGYSSIMTEIRRQPCKKVMVYHNITPPEFVEGETKRHCQMGLEQVATLRGFYDAVVGDSQFNVDCLRKMGVIAQGDVLPIPVEFSGECKKKPRRNVEGAQFLFVGRYVPNKKLEDIIDAFVFYHDFLDRKATLKLVGNADVMPDYSEMLRQKVKALSCSGSIELTGKVTNEQLQKYYDTSDVFLCMSEHEGFCIPLLEAMWHQLPVFAYDAGAVRETMGQGGVVFTDKTPVTVAQLIFTVLSDFNLVQKIIEKQNVRVFDFSKVKIQCKLEKLLNQWLGEGETAVAENAHTGKKLKIQMQGPFETSYSLAQVNRFLIEAMHETGLADVSIHCTEGPGDYIPEEKNLRDKPLAKYLWQKEKTFGTPDVALRNMFPPVTTGLTAQLNFQSFGWEEDRVPQEYVEWFNRDLDGIGTTSDFVTQALKDSGITIPVKTIGNGVRLPKNYEILKPYPLKTEKTVKFLHISSAFPRKGVDVLLETYFETFTAQDDVCLVLKTFPNIHNTTVEQLKKLRDRYPNGPEVEHIDMDLPEDQLYSLYKAASCYVHCARGEGFGLPVAEAMLAKVPVIVCNNTGLADFCREDTCLPVGYMMVKAHSHLTENSRWAEPDQKQLQEQLQNFVFRRKELGVDQKVETAYQLISTYYTWEAAARRWIDFIHEVQAKKERPTVDMVTTWNNKCGIAEFTRYFIENSDQLASYRVFPDTGHELLREDEPFVNERLWHQGVENDDIADLIAALKQSTSEIVHVQYNLGFFSMVALARLCMKLYRHKKVIVLFHATKGIQERLKEADYDYVVNALNHVFRLVVHQQTDREELISMGIRPEKISVLPLGQMIYTPRSMEQARKVLGIQSQHVIGSYGFLLPHKGIEKTIRAVALLKEKYPDIVYIASCSLYDADISREYYKKCRETIQQLHLENHVFLFTDFLDPKESIVLLQACNVLAMVYDKTNESASGAVRFCVAAKRPLITTRQDIFKEFEECSYQIEQNDPRQIAEAIDRMMNPACTQECLKRMEKRIEESSWHTVVRQYLDLYHEKAIPDR